MKSIKLIHVKKKILAPQTRDSLIIHSSHALCERGACKRVERTCTRDPGGVRVRGQFGPRIYDPFSCRCCTPHNTSCCDRATYAQDNYIYTHHRLTQKCAAFVRIGYRNRIITQHAAKAYARDNVNDPSAGSPTETLLRLLLPLNDQVWSTSQQRRRP